MYPGRYHPEADVLFHYTSMDVARILFTPGSDLLCTYYSRLNDSMEVRLGLKFISDALGSQLNLPNDAIFRYNDLMKKAINQKFSLPWILSFSLKRDAINLWGMYTDRRDGGCAIGFDYKQLDNSVDKLQEDRPNGQQTFLYPCLYGDEAKNLIDRFVCMNRTAFEPVKKEDIQEAEVLKVVRLSLLISSICKHECFRDEQEVRMIVFPDCTKEFANCTMVGDKPRIQVGILNVVPSVSSVISDVIVSPHGDSDQLQIELRRMVDPVSPGVHVIKSKIPYRGEY